MPHLAAHIGVYRTGVREAQVGGSAAGKRVGDECAFIGPPAIYRGFAHTRSLGNVLDREVGESILRENLKGAV